MAFDCTEMDKVVAEIKKIEEWLTHCHCTLFPDGNNSDSLLSTLLKVGFCFKVCCVSMLGKLFDCLDFVFSD